MYGAEKQIWDEFVGLFQQSFLNLKRSNTQLHIFKLNCTSGTIRSGVRFIHFRLANIIKVFLRSQNQLQILILNSTIIPVFKITGMLMALLEKNSNALRKLTIFSHFVKNGSSEHSRLLKTIGQFHGLCAISIDYDMLNQGGLAHLANNCTLLNTLLLFVRGNYRVKFSLA